jgi:dTMP kinase
LNKQFKKFISFEGIDFCGKTTQIGLLVDQLKSRGINPIVVREPGGTSISEKIRYLLLSKKFKEMHPITETLLYESARAQLVHQVILPALKKDRYIIADRFFDSTTSYQGFGRKLNITFLVKLHSFSTSELTPFKTFFIDISPQEAQKRRLENKHSQDRLESSGLDFFSRIREGFLYLCETQSNRFIKIDGENSPEEIAKNIWENIKEIWEIS